MSDSVSPEAIQKNETPPALEPAAGHDPPWSRPPVLLGLGAVIAVVAGVLGGLIVHWSTPKAAVVVDTNCDAVALADHVLPSVVTIHVTGRSGSSNGTGEIVRSDGYILTNDHVISSGVDGGTFTVLFSSGETAPATVVGRVTPLDLAVIKVDLPAKLPVIAVATGDVVVGEPVVALGSPLGLDGSVTRGIVSALGRQVTLPADGGTTAIISAAIQTDATINPGNSGGPLVDCQGQMVGVNTAGATTGGDSTGSIGIGFAIPVDLAVPVADELIKTGKFARPTFGMSVAPISPAIAAAYQLPVGLYVRSVAPGGPAATAGIKVGDVITAVAGSPARTEDALTHVAVQSQSGDKVDVTYVREGKTSQATIVLTT